MLSDRSINKIGKHLENEGWTDDEISEALESIDTSKRVVNVAMPLHFKEEAIHHAYCHCKYVLGLNEGSKKYADSFREAYTTYLTEAYDNSRGIEGPGGGSHRRANPAGIEVHLFDQFQDKITSAQEKRDIAEKAPVGLIYMGKDAYLQKEFRGMADRLKNTLGANSSAQPEIVKEIATQYSAAVVSLSNSFMFAFGGYKTKRKFGGRTVYAQGDKSGKTLEFSKKSGTNKDADRKAMLDVAYRQIARQIYIICMSSIIAGSVALNSAVIADMEKGIEREINKQWGARTLKKGENAADKPNLKFVLKREVRDNVVKSFFNYFNPRINEYRSKDEYNLERRDLEANAEKNSPSGKTYSPRRMFLEEVILCVHKWANAGKNTPQPSQPAASARTSIVKIKKR